MSTLQSRETASANQAKALQLTLDAANAELEALRKELSSSRDQNDDLRKQLTISESSFLHHYETSEFQRQLNELSAK
jgi:hypothetical protein